MTPAQQATLKAAILADANVSSAVALHDWYSIAQNYNAATSTQIWKPVVLAQDIMAAILPGDFNGLVGNQAVSIVAMLSGGSVDATNANIQSWFTTQFAGKATTLTNLTVTAQRFATKFENLFVSSQISSVYGVVLNPVDVQQTMGF